MSKLMLEHEETCVLNEQDAFELAENIVTNDIWCCVSASDILSMPIPNVPIYVDSVRKNSNIADEVSDDSIIECMTSGLQLGISCPVDGEMKVYPIGDTGFSSVLSRAGFQQATALSGTTEKRNFQPIGAEEKATIVNYGLETQKEAEIKLLIRDEKIRFAGSSDYAIIPIDSLFKEFKKGLNETFTEVKFISSSYSHEFISIIYEMVDKDIIEEFKSVLERNKLYCDDLRIAVRLTTSDTGLSAVSLYPSLISDSVARIIGSPLCLEHKAGHNIEDFKANLNLIYSMFNDAEKKLEEMEGKRLDNPKGCFLRIAKSVGFPKKLSIKKAEDFLEKFPKPTQLDIYWEIYELYDDFDAASGGLTQNQILNLEEGISRTIFNGIENYDFPFEWL